MTWSREVNPFGENRTPLLIGLSSTDGETVVPVAVDPATGALITEGGSVASSVNATVYQGTNPWVVAGNVTIYGNVTANVVVSQVFQGGAPWSVTGTVTDIQGTNPWTVSGTVTIGAGGGGGSTTVYQGGAPWLVNASVIGQIPVSVTVGTISVGNFPATQPVSGSVTVYGTFGSGSTTVYQGGAPWLVNASVIGTLPVSESGTWTVNASIQGVPGVIATIANASIPVTESGAWGVTATVGNTVSVSQSTNPWLVQATIGIPSVNQGTSPWLVQATIGIPAVSQSGAPWLVNASVIGQIPVSATVPTLVIGLMPAINVAVSQVFQGGAPWLVNASVIGILNVNATVPGVAGVIATVLQGTNPWLTNTSVVGTLPVFATVITFSVGSILSTVTQGTTPWLVSASVGTVNVISTVVTVLQGTSPWLVNASVIGILNVNATVPGVAGVIATVLQGTNPWLVNASIVGQQGVTATYAAPWLVTSTNAGGFVAPTADAGATGATPIRISSLVASCVTIKGTATANLYGYHIYSSNSVVSYVNLFAQTLATTGLTVPTAQLIVPAGGWVDASPATPISFTSGLIVSASSSINGFGNPTNPLITNFWYK